MSKLMQKAQELLKRDKHLSEIIPISDKADVTSLISQLGQLQRQLDQLETEMNEEIGEVSERYAARAVPITKRVQQIKASIADWCEARKAELTDSGQRKTVDFTTGQVSWRKNPNKVKLLGDETELVKMLEARGLSHLVRRWAEVAKDPIRDNPKLVDDIPEIQVIVGKDKFEVKPRVVELEGAA